MSWYDFLDHDNDGAVADDVARTAMDVGGTVSELAGSAMIGLGGILTATGVGAEFGVPLAIGGGILTGVGAIASNESVQDLAEEAGDFLSDAAGTRGPRPYAGPSSDPHYQDGRTDGLGQRLHRLMAGESDGPVVGHRVAPTHGGVAGGQAAGTAGRRRRRRRRRSHKLPPKQEKNP